MWLPLCEGGGDPNGARRRASGVHAMIECHFDELDHDRSVAHHEHPGWAPGRPGVSPDIWLRVGGSWAPEGAPQV
jgi:hypothetical protein